MNGRSSSEAPKSPAPLGPLEQTGLTGGVATPPSTRSIRSQAADHPFPGEAEALPSMLKTLGKSGRGCNEVALVVRQDQFKTTEAFGHFYTDIPKLLGHERLGA
eukprot:9504120-Pyramimonas_sp.AAC.3